MEFRIISLSVYPSSKAAHRRSPSKLEAVRPSSRGDERALTGEDDGGRASLGSHKVGKVTAVACGQSRSRFPLETPLHGPVLELICRDSCSLRLGAATQGQARLAEDGGGKRTIAEKKGLDEA